MYWYSFLIVFSLILWFYVCISKYILY
jgi:hypothetical protein